MPAPPFDEGRSMREFLIRMIRRAPVIEGLWDQYERMLVARDTALVERDAALAERRAALAVRDAAIEARDAVLAGRHAQPQRVAAPHDPYPTSLYAMWAYRLLLGREPEDPQAIAHYAKKPRSELVEIFINSPEFHIRHLIDQIRPPQTRYMAELDNGFRFWLLYSDESISPAMAAGVYESPETAFVKRQVRAGMSVVDIGANLGWFTVHLADIVGEDGRVDAFEPRSDLFDLLEKTTIENHLANVTLHNCALGDKNSNGQVIWSLDDLNPGGTHLVSSDFINSEMSSQNVRVSTLDSSLSHHIDFIKIDVEGSEPLVFSGAERILLEDRPTILVEINPSNLLRTSGSTTEKFGGLVEKFNYRLFQISADGSCGRQITTSELSAVQHIVNVAMLPQDRVEFALAT
jgi:FkbM family methyltransferase